MAELKHEVATLFAEIQDLALATGIKPSPRARQLKSDREPHQTIQNAITALQGIEETPQLKLRTIHHFSCTGGTMLAKCIASMANTVVLNEVDPLSAIPFRGDLDRFSPTDLVALLHQSGSAPDPALVADLFGNSIKQVAEHLEQSGKALVLRDHTHSHFLYGEGRDNRYTLTNILAGAGLPMVSLVTVRHPARSYQSMVKAGWDAHLTPNTFDEYCQRYLSFLEAYAGTPIVRYEDFVAAPDQVMQTICDHLELGYFAEFQEVFDSFKFSGDSGRTSGTIEPRPPSPIDDTLREQLNCSSYRELVEKLNYDSAV
jgi:hypothetical protein